MDFGWCRSAVASLKFGFDAVATADVNETMCDANVGHI